jgi:hypothetical protein
MPLSRITENSSDDHTSMIEIKSQFCHLNVIDRMKKVLELQIEFIKSIIGKTYSSINEVNRLVIKNLNDFSLSMGFKALI